jgi:hypothetical protein
MSEQEWLTKEMRRALRWRLAAWSDGPGYRQACELAESYRHLLPRPVTPSQLHGLRNVVSAETDPQKVKNFTKRQAEKAERRGDLELRDYWQAVGQALDGLRGQGEALWRDIGGEELNLSKKQRQNALSGIQSQLIRLFVQHLVAHSAYLKKQPEEYA